ALGTATGINNQLRMAAYDQAILATGRQASFAGDAAKAMLAGRGWAALRAGYDARLVGISKLDEFLQPEVKYQAAQEYDLQRLGRWRFRGRWGWGAAPTARWCVCSKALTTGWRSSRGWAGPARRRGSHRAGRLNHTCRRSPLVGASIISQP